AGQCPRQAHHAPRSFQGSRPAPHRNGDALGISSPSRLHVRLLLLLIALRCLWWYGRAATRWSRRGRTRSGTRLGSASANLVLPERSCTDPPLQARVAFPSITLAHCSTSFGTARSSIKW